MPKKAKTAEEAISDGSQAAAVDACAAALKELPHESKIRVLACIAILFDAGDDLITRLFASSRRR